MGLVLEAQIPENVVNQMKEFVVNHRNLQHTLTSQFELVSSNSHDTNWQ